MVLVATNRQRVCVFVCFDRLELARMPESLIRRRMREFENLNFRLALDEGKQVSQQCHSHFSPLRVYVYVCVNVTRAYECVSRDVCVCVNVCECL